MAYSHLLLTGPGELNAQSQSPFLLQGLILFRSFVSVSSLSSSLATASASPSCAMAAWEPPLKARKPNSRMKPPSAARGTEWPVGKYRGRRGSQSKLLKRTDRPAAVLVSGAFDSLLLVHQQWLSGGVVKTKNTRVRYKQLVGRPLCSEIRRKVSQKTSTNASTDYSIGETRKLMHKPLGETSVLTDYHSKYFLKDKSINERRAAQCEQI